MADQVYNEQQIVGVYKGLEYQHIGHNRAPSNGYDNGFQSKNQIVSQSKIIIPKGIINFKKVHSVSAERNNGNDYQEPQKVHITFNEVEHKLPNQEIISNNESGSQEGATFMLEPRDESLMRKKKVIEILKTFQVEEDPAQIEESKKQKKSGNFGEEYDPVKHQNKKLGQQIDPFNLEPINNTFNVGKPIIV